MFAPSYNDSKTCECTLSAFPLALFTTPHNTSPSKLPTIPATDTDPFGNKTVFSCPDQVTVNPATTQKTYHYVFRDANSYAKSVAMSANAEVHTGFFKASVSVQQAHQIMSDGLNIIAESTSEIGIYTITLDAPLVLQLDEKLKQFIETLPDEYNTTTADAFDQFVQFYGTHYVSAITLGGKATMHSIITHAFAGTHSNTVVQAQVSASRDGIGGGGGHTHSTPIPGTISLKTLRNTPRWSDHTY